MRTVEPICISLVAYTKRLVNRRIENADFLHSDGLLHFQTKCVVYIRSVMVHGCLPRSGVKIS